jgi:hypothetical protein
MLKTLRWCVVVSLFFGAVAKADDAKSQSPKDALRHQDAAAKEGNREQDLLLYQATNDKEKKLADAIADGDVALARLEKAVTDKFGKEAAANVVHAASSMNLEDIDKAKEKIDGDKATIEWTGKKAPSLHLVKVDGQWKIPMSEIVGSLDDKESEELAKKFKEVAEQLTQTADTVEKDKYRSGEGVRDKVQELHDQFFGASTEK